MNPSDFKGLEGGVWGPRESIEHPGGGKAWLRPPALAEIPLLHALLHAEVSRDAGTAQAMAAVFLHNSDSFWIIEHLPENGETPRLGGFYAFLLLTADGLCALKSGTLNRTEPPLSLLTPQGARAAAIYIWAIVARRLMRRMMPLIARAMGAPLYADALIYAVVATEDGRKAGIGTGFAASEAGSGIQLGSLMQLPPWSQGPLA